jgi:hypothetical protein
MLEIFSRVTGSGGGTGEAELFNGLRVRMVSRHAIMLRCAFPGGCAMRFAGWAATWVHGADQCDMKLDAIRGALGQGERGRAVRRAEGLAWLLSKSDWL